MLPQTVPAGASDERHLLNGSAREFATMAGPALGGILITVWGSEPVYYGQAICALISAWSFSNVEVPAHPAESLPAPGLKGTLEGLRFVWRDKAVLAAMSLDLFAVLFGGARALLPIYAQDILHAGATGLGWLEAAPAVGAALMSIALAHFGTIAAAGRVMLWSVVGLALGPSSSLFPPTSGCRWRRCSL